MIDAVLQNFLEKQFEEAMSLAAASDIVEVFPESTTAPQRYLVRFHCGGLVQPQNGPVQGRTGFEVGIQFPDDYLRTSDTMQVVMILRPWTVWHPNVRGPMICLGKLTPGTGLVDILFQIYEVLTYQRWSAHDGLNPAACEWARNNSSRFPIDQRPLKWKEVRS